MTYHSEESLERQSPEGKRIPYPKSIIFIIGTEFCERFSYYGMRTILTIYFISVMGYSDNVATELYHIFSTINFFTPVFGAIIADSLLGKFYTIFSISIVYAAGNILLSGASTTGIVWLTFLGLGLIAFGTGGIKPCVSAFGGDQFAPEQTKQLEKFFSIFYISINAGSLISTFLTPILRENVRCFNQNSCYPLAFGVPAILMVVAVIVFFLGRFITGYNMIPPQKDNVIIMVVKCVCHALKRKLFTRHIPKKDHWLEYADDQYSNKTIAEVRVLMSVLFLYIPLPIFWALFDQQGSRWTIQATQMNGKIGNFLLLPDQIQVVNPVLIILMIPAYQYIIYPILSRLGINRPLQKMTIGGILAAVAFIICGFVQLSIETELPVELVTDHYHLAVINGLPATTTNDCRLTYNGTIVESNSAQIFPNVANYDLENFQQKFIVTNCSTNGEYQVNIGIQLDTPTSSVILVVTDKLYRATPPNVDVLQTEDNMLAKPTTRNDATLYTIFRLENFQNQSFMVTDAKETPTIKDLQEVNNDGSATIVTLGQLNPIEVEIKGGDVIMSIDTLNNEKLPLQQGGTYIEWINGDVGQPQTLTFATTNIVVANQLSVALQIIQYIIMTCAEVMFSVTGLEFSYSQAPTSMKSVLQACWLLTMAFGNLIIVIVANLTIFPYQSWEFFFFGCLMLVDILLFAIIAYYYKKPVLANYDADNNGNDSNNFSNNNIGGNGRNITNNNDNGIVQTNISKKIFDED